MVRTHRGVGGWVAAALLVALSVSGCGEEGEGGGGNGTPDDPATACNEANEDCAPGICGGEGGRMLPGSDCLSCHSSGSGAGEARPFTAAGTVFSDIDGGAPASGATVRITDAMGRSVELTTNAAGNFYTRQPLTAPLQAQVTYGGTTRQMANPVSSGACNGCHKCGGAAGGKLYTP